jgi:hypothetical protein
VQAPGGSEAVPPSTGAAFGSPTGFTDVKKTLFPDRAEGVPSTPATQQQQPPQQQDLEVEFAHGPPTGASAFSDDEA